MRSVTIPSSVASIGNNAFIGSQRLSEVQVDPGNDTFINDAGVLLDRSRSTVILCPPAKIGDYVIPAWVTIIAERAFANSGLTNVTIPEGVVSIGDYAFHSSRLTSVALPESLVTVGNGLFDQCGALASVTFGSSVTSIGDSAFQGTGLTTVTLPDSLISLGKSAFGNCRGLTTVHLGVNVRRIGSLAFTQCASLLSISIPASVETLGSSAFTTTYLQSIYFQGDAPGGATSVTLWSTPVLYYLLGTSGWDDPSFRRSAVLWDPCILTGPGQLQLSNGKLGLTIKGERDLPLVVESSDSLDGANWTPIAEITLDRFGKATVRDEATAGVAARYYRLRQP